jgi:hypothetical protein
MFRATRVVVACLLALPASSRAEDDKKKPPILEEMKRREKEIADSEARKEWKKINWRSSPTEAVADATKANKPLLVVLIVGERGRPNAERC